MRKTKDVTFNVSSDDLLKMIEKEQKSVSEKKKAKVLKDTRERFDKFAKLLKILGPEGEEEFKPFTWQKNLGLAFQQAYESKKKYQRNFVIVTPASGRNDYASVRILAMAHLHEGVQESWNSL